jgi:gamma-glutamyltranspeptidase / glutathione hydrolase
MITRRQFVTNAAIAGGMAMLHLQGVRGQSLSGGTREGAAATVHPLATQAAMEILHAGGNAIDAAIAAALVLGVVDGHNSGIGGGCLVLLRLADGRIRAVDGRETAGAAAHRDMFVRNGKADASLSQTGPLACGVPGQIAAMQRMHQAHGKLAWASLFESAIGAAQNGHAISKTMSRTIANEAEALARFPASRQVLLHADQSPLREGAWLVQTDLAETLRQVAHHGADWFYLNGFAKSCCEYLQTLGGILTPEDFRRYQALDRTPIAVEYRGHSVIGFPPPSSGGLHIAQILTMLRPFPVQAWFQESPSRALHLLAECMKRAFADRATWLGDSDFVHVPSNLLDPAYLHERMRDFSEAQATGGIQHGVPAGAESLPGAGQAAPADGLDGKHTTHLTVADAEGNWVAMTCTVNTSWGSKVMVPGTGVMLNNEMDDFSIAPGEPNAFGLVGSQANEVAPGKRPLSSMSPTLVLDPQGNPWLTCGAAGGPRIINATLQVLIRAIDLQQPITDAIAAPRIHHQWRPDTLALEVGLPHQPDTAFSEQTLEQLRARGHTLRNSTGLGVAQGIQRIGHQLVAAHDPRSDGASFHGTAQ